MNRRSFLQFPLYLPFITRSLQSSNPNILVIEVDDMIAYFNDLDISTPNINALAQGGINFDQAQCPGPMCGPARTSILTGLQPWQTGVYDNGQPWRERNPCVVTLPDYFRQNGYHTVGIGNTFHNTPKYNDWPAWTEYHHPQFKQDIPTPAAVPNAGFNALWDWSVVDLPPDSEEWGDTRVANEAVNQLGRNFGKPFFMMAGFTFPHNPWYVPRQFFDLYPSKTWPTVLENDLDDVPQIAKDLFYVVPPTDELIAALGAGYALRCYYAAISYVDWQIGRILEALNNSPYADNTYVVLFSDQGFHLGQKERWGKRTLWGESCRSTFVLAGPGIAPRVEDKPCGLIDIYPTLIGLAELPARECLAGRSLVPMPSNYHAVTAFGSNYSVRKGAWRYNAYSDGSEELYDLRIDPHEWHNLIPGFGQPGTLEVLRGVLPSL